MPDLDDDDLIDELPPVGRVGREEEAGLESDELDLDSLIEEGEEEVGLDDSVGLDDAAPLFALELPPADAASRDEAADDLDAIEIEGLSGDDEYGWTEDSAAAADAPWDPAELDMPNLTPLGRDDGGEEGVDEVFEIMGGDEDSVAHLPSLEADLDDDEEPVEDPLFDALVLPTRGPELPGAYEPERCVAARLTPAIPIRSALVTARASWAVGDAIFAIEGDEATRVLAGGLEERRSLALAAGDDGHRLVVGTDRGIARSVDRGASFLISGAMAQGAFEVSREPDTDRIWAFSSAGALHRSDDLGGVWSGPLLLKPVVALVTPPGEGVVTLCAPATAPPQLARSIDGGQRWAAVDVPELPRGDEDAPARLSLAASGELVAIASDADRQGPFLSTDLGKTWLRVPGLPTAEALAVARERGGASIYAVHRARDGRRVVVRHRPDGADSGAVLELTDPSATIERLVLDVRRDGTVLYAATSVGLYRVTLTWEGT